MNTHLPSSTLTIRPATLSDAPFIKKIAEETWPTAYSIILSKDQLEYMLDKMYSLDSLQQQMQDGHYYFLALQNFRPVGFASFSSIDASTYKLQKLYVLPSQQKTGAGKTLLSTIEESAKGMGAKILLLNVNRHNPAKVFYERNGYSIVKEEDIDIGNGYFMNDYIMQKDLESF